MNSLLQVFAFSSELYLPVQAFGGELILEKLRLCFFALLRMLFLLTFIIAKIQKVYENRFFASAIKKSIEAGFFNEPALITLAGSFPINIFFTGVSVFFPTDRIWNIRNRNNFIRYMPWTVIIPKYGINFLFNRLPSK